MRRRQGDEGRRTETEERATAPVGTSALARESWWPALGVGFSRRALALGGRE